MRRNWRAPACYVGVALICIVYVWIMPSVGVTDICAGAGIGAALMWALNDWETRQAARRKARPRPPLMRILASRIRAMARAARGVEVHEPPVEARPPSGEVRRLARAAAVAAEDPIAEAPIEASVPPRAPKRETPIEAWRREVRDRDIERMETQLRALAEEPPARPFGAPDERPRPAPGPVRREPVDRWQRPSRTRSTPR